jgi:hypothetical protein
MGRRGEGRHCQVNFTLNDAELERVSSRAKAAGYNATSAFVRDLVTFNIGAADPWSWASWGLTITEVERLKRAADISGRPVLEWIKTVCLFWSEEPWPKKLKRLR